MSSNLVFYLACEFSQETVDALRRMTDVLCTLHPWTLGDPEFVDELDEESELAPGDRALRTVGVLLRVSDVGEVPETPRAELLSLIEAITKFSGEQHVEFEAQLGQTFIGTVNERGPNRTIREGLLDTWLGCGGPSTFRA